MEETFDAVVLANGLFPVHAVPLAVLRSARRLVCCDGAALPEADAIVGDGDSVGAAYRDRLICVAEQDDNDLTKATRYCLQQGWRRLAYLGCTGKREDHTLGNISLMMRYRREFDVEPTMVTDEGIFRTACGQHAFSAFAGQQVSIFNFGCTRIESTGLKWPAYAYEEWWQGTLNEATGSRFTIRADGFYLVFQTHSAKQ